MKTQSNNIKTSTVKYFVYARKSTRGEDKQILSIQSQKDALEKLVHEQSLSVVDTITEAGIRARTGPTTIQ